jgi:hypothetical protein
MPCLAAVFAELSTRVLMAMVVVRPVVYLWSNQMTSVVKPTICFSVGQL